MVKAKVDDETILKTLKDFKALSEPELEEILNYSKNGLYNRLHNLVRKNKIYEKKIPTMGSHTNLKILRKYQGLRVYSLDEEHFREWLLSQMPARISPLYRRLFTILVHDIGLDVPLPENKTKHQLWIYDSKIYAFLEKLAKKKKKNISGVAEDIIKEKMSRRKKR
jgi:hypothetical protein